MLQRSSQDSISNCNQSYMLDIWRKRPMVTGLEKEKFWIHKNVLFPQKPFVDKENFLQLQDTYAWVLRDKIPSSSLLTSEQSERMKLYECISSGYLQLCCNSHHSKNQNTAQGKSLHFSVRQAICIHESPYMPRQFTQATC